MSWQSQPSQPWQSQQQPQQSPPYGNSSSCNYIGSSQCPQQQQQYTQQQQQGSQQYQQQQNFSCQQLSQSYTQPQRQQQQQQYSSYGNSLSCSNIGNSQYPQQNPQPQYQQQQFNQQQQQSSHYQPPQQFNQYQQQQQPQPPQQHQWPPQQQPQPRPSQIGQWPPQQQQQGSQQYQQQQQNSQYQQPPFHQGQPQRSPPPYNSLDCSQQRWQQQQQFNQQQQQCTPHGNSLSCNNIGNSQYPQQNAQPQWQQQSSHYQPPQQFNQYQQQPQPPQQNQYQQQPQPQPSPSQIGQWPPQQQPQPQPPQQSLDFNERSSFSSGNQNGGTWGQGNQLQPQPPPQPQLQQSQQGRKEPYSHSYNECDDGDLAGTSTTDECSGAPVMMQDCQCPICSKLPPRQEQSYVDPIYPQPFHLGNPYPSTKKSCSEVEAVTKCSWKPAMYALIGMALGDSLGIPFENCKPKEAVLFWKRDSQYPQEMVRLGAIWTDDTQQSLSVMEAFMQPNHYTGVTPKLRGLLNTKEVLELWKHLSAQSTATGSKVEYGGFRGTGTNFRTTMEAPSDDVRSTYTAGNGVVMKVVPFAIAAHDSEFENNNELKICALSKNLIEVAKITTHNLVAVTPAFSVAYLIFRFIDPVRRSCYISKDIIEILNDIGKFTYEFETMIGKDTFFTRNSWDKKIVHSYTDILKEVIHRISSKKKPMDPDEVINDMARFVTECANKITKKQVLSLNDGMGVTTALSAILFALLYKDRPFLSVLQAMYYYGGDTDSVGAVLGGLLGAVKGEIPPNVTNMLIEYNALTNFFRRFIDHVKAVPKTGYHSITWPSKVTDKYVSFIDTEVAINKAIGSASDRNITVRDIKGKR